MSRQNKMIGGLVMSKKENFVFLASWYDILKGYDTAGKPEMASEIAKQIIYYGVTGEITSEDPIVAGTVTGMCAALINNSKKRYSNCVSNGKKGGKPEQFSLDDILNLQKQGLSEQEIADRLGCSIKTVQRKLEKAEEEDI
jgi:AraC-like DNA-binding protein